MRGRRLAVPHDADLLPLSALVDDPEGWEVLVAPTDGNHRNRRNGRWFSAGFLLNPAYDLTTDTSLRHAPIDLYLIVRRCHPEDRRKDSLT